MAEQSNATTADMPIFRLEKLYLKDLSFESPNTPDVFFLQDQEPKVEMNLKLTNKKLDETASMQRIHNLSPWIRCGQFRFSIRPS